MKPDWQRYRTYSRGRSVRLSPEHYTAKGEFCFLTACCLDRTPYLSQPAAAQAAFDTWKEAAAHLGFRLWGFCVMPDHLHVLIQPIMEARSISNYVKSAKTLTQKRLRGTAPLRWQAKFHDHVLRSDENPRVQLLYLLENPVRKGLVDDWKAWPWSYWDPEALI